MRNNYDGFDRNDVVLRLQTAMKERGLRIPDVARLVGCKPTIIYRWFDKTRVPSINVLLAVCKAIHITPDYLFKFGAYEERSDAN